MKELKKYFESQPWNQPLIIQLGLNLDKYIDSINYIKKNYPYWWTSQDPFDALSDKTLIEDLKFTQNEVDFVRAFQEAEKIYDPNYYVHSGFQGCFENQLKKIKQERQKK